ncbi:DNA polymerase type-X family protein pol4 [Colletotrichum kahawae]|uniref:DNA polymerase n=1 Tax=Colletotrichum kahawae TaxID=34407 RepID=A0AAE0CWQ3_COLKA|nr:DNA polymerase type-X family protein pol4 [Colletotrichum kahawae]
MATDLEFPLIFLLPTHLDIDRLHELEKKIPSLTYDIQEAEVILGNISKRPRALFELRQRKLHTVPVEIATESQPPDSSRKRKRSEGSSDSDSSAYTEDGQGNGPTAWPVPQTLLKSLDVDIVRVVKLNWLTESLDQGRVLPLRDFVIYEGRKCGEESNTLVAVKGSDVLARAVADTTLQDHQNVFRRSEENASASASQRTTMPSLLRRTTSEHDSALILPPIPGFLRTTYACQRATPVDPPNAAFIEELKAIRTTRKLMGDEIGERAYSTSIATLSAYPYKISSPQEVARLPGCGTKVAELWHEWKDTGRLREASEAQADPKLSVLQTFYDIWRVGDATARDFYKKGWRDLDDIVEHGWDGLSRVQQIGVKFYDELKLKITRVEVESIADTILKHARKFSPGYQMVIVGGYRRGKHNSGDVDMIISHPDESATLNFVEKLVVSLEKSGQITHTLTLSNHNSERGQRPLSWSANQGRGGGFDTLDKALVVWQEPEMSDRGKSSSIDSASQRPPHRRVDIIISPWKTAGCAVLGWSGDTTFQRDLRRYCKKQRDLKFDSSGIRSRLDGSWLDLEGNGKAPEMVTAEKRVFEGLGLDWVRPEDRCTG